MQVGTLSKNLDQWRSLTFNRFVVKIVLHHYLQVRYHHPLFHDLTLFNIKVAMAYHPLIQKKVGGLIVRDSIEPYMGGAGLYSSLSNFIALCTYLPLRCLLSDRYCILFNKVIIFFV